MVQNIAFQPVNIATSSADSEGRLVLVDGRLVAVLVRLRDEIHGGDVQGAWFVEVAFGVLDGRADTATFATLEEAAQWIRQLCERRQPSILSHPDA